MRVRRALARAICLAVCLTAVPMPSPASASDGDGDTAALLQADRVILNKNDERVRAEGNVEISRGERVLMADAITYDRETGVVTAEGNISFLTRTGEVVFADEMKITDDMAEGAMRGFRMLLADRSRIAAAKAVRVNDNRTRMRKVVFSPCRTCVSGPDDTPFWQLKAETVVHDQDARTLTYEDARLEILGVPVAYTPYLSHPGPRKKRQSGVLSPTVRISDQLGPRVDVPVYVNIDRNRGLTVTPILSADQGLAVAGEYRAKTKTGKYTLRGSGTVADRERAGAGEADNVFRGHVNSTGQFAIDDAWRWGFQARRASDDTYLRVYDFPSERFLESTLDIERLYGSSYFQAQAAAYQGTRQGDDDDALPLAAPELTYSSGPLTELAGGHPFVEGHAHALSRVDGRDVQRAGGTAGWSWRTRDALGGTTGVTAALHLDGVATNDHAPGNAAVQAGSNREDADARAVPQAAVGYRLPFQRRGVLGREVVTPRVQLVAAPNDTRDTDFPNEDSRDLEFDTTNLFQLNRFPGRDRISSGQRVDYAVNYSVFRQAGGMLADATLGQSYRITAGSATPSFLGGDTATSDIVGRLALHPRDRVRLSHRFRLDDETLDMRRNEAALRAGPAALNGEVTYTQLENRGTLGTTTYGAREELTADIRSRLTRDWSLRGRHRHNLNTGETLVTEGGVTYHCDCGQLDLLVRHSNFQDRGLDKDTSVRLRFMLEHLGTFGGSG